jgi:hypothetical protein
MKRKELSGPELYRQAVLALAGQLLRSLAIKLELQEAAEILHGLRDPNQVAPLLRGELLPYLRSPGPRYPERFGLSVAAYAVADAAESLHLTEDETQWQQSLREALIALAALGLGDDPTVVLCGTNSEPAFLLVAGPLLSDLWAERTGAA